MPGTIRASAAHGKIHQTRITTPGFTQVRLAESYYACKTLNVLDVGMTIQLKKDPSPDNRRTLWLGKVWLRSV
jgi:hypothetical protein